MRRSRNRTEGTEGTKETKGRDLMVVALTEAGLEVERSAVTLGAAHRWARFQSEMMGLGYVIRGRRIEAVFRRGRLVHFLAGAGPATRQLELDLGAAGAWAG